MELEIKCEVCDRELAAGTIQDSHRNTYVIDEGGYDRGYMEDIVAKGGA